MALVALLLVVLSMGVLTYRGATAKEALGSELLEAVPVWAERQGFEDNEDAVAGAGSSPRPAAPSATSISARARRISAPPS